MRKKIHVMQATFGMGIGGMERVIMDLCRHVDPQRYRFSICCLTVRGPFADQMESEGVPVHFCENQSRVAKYLRGFELAGILRKSDVQVLHTHNTSALVDGVIGARIAGVPVHVHTDHSKGYPIKWRQEFMARTAARYTDEVVAVSAHTRAQLIQYERIAADRISVIANGLNVALKRYDSLDEKRKEIGLAADDLVVGVVARLEDQKGLDLLLDAAPAVASRFPKVRFLIVGGGSREHDLKAQAAEAGVAGRVIFTGWREDAPDLIPLFDCFVLPSRYEGMPMVLLEAMAMSKPIVATAVGGVPEFVQDGKSGALVHSRDPAELARALGGLLSNLDHARAMGRYGRTLYEEHFTAAAMATSYERLFRKHLERKGIEVA